MLSRTRADAAERVGLSFALLIAPSRPAASRSQKAAAGKEEEKKCSQSRPTAGLTAGETIDTGRRLRGRDGQERARERRQKEEQQTLQRPADRWANWRPASPPMLDADGCRCRSMQSPPI